MMKEKIALRLAASRLQIGLNDSSDFDARVILDDPCGLFLKPLLLDETAARADYAIDGLVSLHDYLRQCEFDEYSAVQFLYGLLHSLRDALVSQPVVLDLQAIYLRPEGTTLRFVRAPLQFACWMKRQKDVLSLFADLLLAFEGSCRFVRGILFELCIARLSIADAIAALESCTLKPASRFRRSGRTKMKPYLGKKPFYPLSEIREDATIQPVLSQELSSCIAQGREQSPLQLEALYLANDPDSHSDARFDAVSDALSDDFSALSTLSGDPGQSDKRSPIQDHRQRKGKKRRRKAGKAWDRRAWTKPADPDSFLAGGFSDSGFDEDPIGMPCLQEDGLSGQSGLPLFSAGENPAFRSSAAGRLTGAQSMEPAAASDSPKETVKSDPLDAGWTSPARQKPVSLFDEPSGQVNSSSAHPDREKRECRADEEFGMHEKHSNQPEKDDHSPDELSASVCPKPSAPDQSASKTASPTRTPVRLWPVEMPAESACDHEQPVR